MTRTFSLGPPSICAITLRWLTTPCVVSYKVNAVPSQTATDACSSMGLCVSGGIVSLIHLDLRRLERFRRVATLAFDFWIRLRRQLPFHVRLLLAVRDLDRVCGRHRLLERVRDRERDVLAVIADHIVLERGPRLVEVRHLRIEAKSDRCAKQPADVVAQEDRAHTRHLLGGTRVDLLNFSAGDRGADGNRVQHVWEMVVRRVHGLPAHLKRAVDAWPCLADDGKRGCLSCRHDEFSWRGLS